MEYLKDRKYYVDLYDLSTIKECLKMVDFFADVYVKTGKEPKTKDIPKGERAKTFNWMTNQIIFQIKAKRFSQKEATILNWMNDDKAKQDKYDFTPIPQDINCPNCSNIMQNTYKHLNILAKPLTMQFIFSCASCKEKRWIQEDGTEKKYKPHLCPKCKSEVKMSLVEESAEKIVWKTTCSRCDFTETTIDDFTKSNKEWKKKEDHEKKLLEVHRNSFASEDVGKAAFEYTEALKVANEVYEEEVKKYDSSAYQKVIHIKKINIPNLEKMLYVLFEKNKFIKFSFDKPEMGQYVIVTFTAQDIGSPRKQNESISLLTKLLHETLEDTNWRLMTDGISYRLGYISGRLKAYESEEELFKLSGGHKKVNSCKLDPEFRMKYESNNVVQLARISGEFEGIKKARKRRLVKEPEGFFLQASEGNFDCGICGEHHLGNEIWWNLDGQRCVDCWRNIKEGIIPSLPHRYDNDGVYFQNWQIDDYGVHPSTARKLIRQGILKGRDLKRKDGTVYCTIFLESENKKFLKEHPKKPRQKFIITDLLGEKVEL